MSRSERYTHCGPLRSYDRHQPLRLPGQEAEQLAVGANGATERSYNIHRWYRGGWGRYSQADPVGASRSANLFSYVLGHPLIFSDPLGLWLKNNTPCTLFIKESERGKVHPVPPGREWPVELDGYADPCKHPNEVFKSTDFVDIDVDSKHVPHTLIRKDMVTLREEYGYRLRQDEGHVENVKEGGWHGRDFLIILHNQKPSDNGWDDLFSLSKPENCCCKCK